MSSSGKGQSTIKSKDVIEKAWEYSQSGSRSGAGKVIVEGFIDFDYEITLLTVRHRNGTSFCEPIGHIQIDGDYRYSWQPQPMANKAIEQAKDYAKKITDALGGFGIFGVELFIKNDEAIFSEVSPRPHDTGMVTLISQDLSEFALHARAILGLSIPNIAFHGFSASTAILAEGHSKNFRFENLEEALAEPNTSLRLFGKPEVAGHRRVGVALARGNSLQEARDKATAVRDKNRIVM
jgi:phosphoribosylglycinamide formyltransferase 2